MQRVSPEAALTFNISLPGQSTGSFNLIYSEPRARAAMALANALGYTTSVFAEHEPNTVPVESSRTQLFKFMEMLIDRQMYANYTQGPFTTFTIFYEDGEDSYALDVAVPNICMRVYSRYLSDVSDIVAEYQSGKPGTCPKAILKCRGVIKNEADVRYHVLALALPEPSNLNVRAAFHDYMEAWNA